MKISEAIRDLADYLVENGDAELDWLSYYDGLSKELDIKVKPKNNEKETY